MEAPQDALMAISSSPFQAASARPLRVLVAEDKLINQKVAIAALKKLGHTGVVVDDGEKAMRALAHMTFDVILLDVMMPNMDGLQVLAAVREGERHTSMRQLIVMATAHDSPGDRERLLLSGADGYVAKPVDAPRLQAEFDRVLGH